jgi:SCY1-like protein 1
LLSPFCTTAVLSILQPLFYVAANFLDENFGKELTGIIGLLFGVNDRGVRGALLQKATLFAKYMDKNALNQAVFEPMCSGFSDSSAALRELTLKATLVLVPYLFQPNLEKLSRYLVRLQSDPEASIRTNTVIFFSKLAPYLTDTTRQKLLLPAFTRALKDNFKPCRLAALQSTLKAKEYFDPRGVAANVLPVVTPQLLDPAKEVRKEAFAVVDELLFFLRQESERMNALPEYEQGMAASNHSGAAPKIGPPVPAGNHKPPTQEKKTPAPSSGGYLSGMTSWMSTSTKPADSGQAATGTPVATAPTTAPLPPGSLAPAASMNMMSITPAASTNMIAIDDDDDLMDDGGDGWDDDDLDLDSGGAKTDSTGGGASSLGGSLLGPPQASASLEEDFFGSFEAKPMKSASLRPGSSGKLTMPAKKTKAAISVTKLAVEPDAEDGWDDF